MADFTAVVAGVLSVDVEEERLDRRFGLAGCHEKALEQMMNDVGLVSATSGGGWFTLQLAYSRRFIDLVTKMASEPKKAGELFNERWIAPMLIGSGPPARPSQVSRCQPLKNAINKLQSLLGKTGKLDKALLAKILTVTNEFIDDLALWLKLDPQVVEAFHELAHVFEVILLVAYGSRDGVYSWNAMVSWMFEQTAGITPEMTMDSTPNPWANGKVVSAGTSVSTSRTLINPVPGQRVFYEVLPGEPTRAEIQTWAPGMFTYRMGSGQRQAPLDFCPTPNCMDVSLRYHSKQETVQSNSPLVDTYAKSFTKNAGGLPISLVAGTSSADVPLQAPVLTDDNLALICGACDMQFASWVTHHPDAGAFESGRELWKHANNFAADVPDAAALYARQGLNALVDGGGVDLTGINQAVAAGSEEVVVWLDQYAVDNARTWVNHWPSELPNGHKTPVQTIFQSPSREAVIASVYKNTTGESFYIYPKEATKYLVSLSYGSVPDSVTAANPYWGLPGGKRIKVSFVQIMTKDIDFAPKTDFFEYGPLVQEIIDCVRHPDNRGFSKGVIGIHAR